MTPKFSSRLTFATLIASNGHNFTYRLFLWFGKCWFWGSDDWYRRCSIILFFIAWFTKERIVFYIISVRTNQLFGHEKIVFKTCHAQRTISLRNKDITQAFIDECLQFISNLFPLLSVSSGFPLSVWRIFNTFQQFVSVRVSTKEHTEIAIAAWIETRSIDEHSLFTHVNNAIARILILPHKKTYLTKQRQDFVYLDKILAAIGILNGLIIWPRIIIVTHTNPISHFGEVYSHQFI